MLHQMVEVDSFTTPSSILSCSNTASLFNLFSLLNSFLNIMCVFIGLKQFAQKKAHPECAFLKLVLLV